MREPNQKARRNAYIASLGTLVIVCGFLAGKVTSCSTSTNVTPPTPAPAPAPAPAPTPTPTPPKPTKPKCDTVTTFGKVQPVLATDCAGCHAGIDQYATAKAWGPKIPTHVDVTDVSNPLHMPQGGSLTDKEIANFDSWAKDGFLADTDCDGSTTTNGGTTPPTPTPPFQSWSQVEGQMFQDLQKVAVSDQPNTRYLIYTDRIDAGVAADELAHNKAAIAKATASVSPVAGIFPPTQVAPGIFRINIDDLGISATQWNDIENASLLNLESFTAVGQQMKQQTGTRLPWMLASEFNDTVLRNATVYYNLVRAPKTLAQLEQNIGVDFAGDLQAFKVIQVGFNGSQLSPAANRLMARWDAKVAANGNFWITEDTGAIKSDQQNIFKNPLIAAAGGKANLKFAAGEMIYTLPNGMQGYFLADAAGNRLDQANEEVVHDFTTNPISPTIKNSISCMRCHYGGIIHAFDHVRDSLSTPGSQLGAADAQIALALYQPQSVIDAKMKFDNETFATAEKRLGVDPTQPDPISQVSDKFLGDLTIKDVASIFHWTPEQFTTNCLNVSSNVRAQAAQLLAPNGTLSHDQLVQVAKFIQVDCRPFFDPLTQ